MKKKKILFISMIKIFPASAGGMIRPAVFCRALAELGYEVEIYSFTARRDDYLARKSSYSHSPVPGVTEYVSTSIFHFILHRLFKILKAPPIWPLFLTSLGYCPRELRNKLKVADFVVSEYMFTMKRRRILSSAPWFADSHNIEYLREARQGGIHKLYAKVVRFFEERVSRSYDGVLACTEEEIEFFKRNAEEGFQNILVPNGVDAKSYLKKLPRPDIFPKGDGTTVFLFFGSDYYANADAASFLRTFAHEHAEFLQEKDVYFLVAGSVHRESFQEGAYIASSFVDDPVQFYGNADFFINPMALGSGSNIKIAEAISAKLPILSTPFGMRGFSGQANNHYLQFDREQIKDAIEAALGMSQEDREHMAENYRTLVLEEIDGKCIAQAKLLPLIESERD